MSALPAFVCIDGGFIMFTLGQLILQILASMGDWCLTCSGLSLSLKRLFTCRLGVAFVAVCPVEVKLPDVSNCIIPVEVPLLAIKDCAASDRALDPPKSDRQG